MAKRLLLILTTLTIAACSAGPPSETAVADLPDIDADAVLGHIEALASDEFEGRAPGTSGEALTVQYLIDQFTAIGAEPGNPDGTFIQRVPLVGITPVPETPFVVRHNGQTREFAIDGDVVAHSRHVAAQARLDDSELVFVGYGVQAPEYDWDDYGDMDLAGKTLLVLVNDPPIPDPADPAALDPDTFGGRAMTYYGRWTYKYEKAAELGAAGVLVIHETEPAGYPFSVIQGMGEGFNLVTPDQNLGRAAIEGWISVDAATELLAMAGQDYAALKAQAASRDFQPVALGATASVALNLETRTIDSQNVIAKIPGSDPALADEYVVYMAHWDHLGVGTPVDGDTIYNGAMDNASGTATLLDIARAVAALPEAPKRSMLFLAVTAEEQGLLGSEYYGQFPLYPLDKTLAAINLDGMNMWGRTSDIVVIGLGASDLDDYITAAAAEQGRTIVPDAEPEKGFYYRSDHFNFAKVGVPALYKDDGVEFIDKPEGYGQQKRDEYTNIDYHAPSDEVKPDWDLAGLAEDAKLLLAVGVRVANADAFPEWKPGTEFKSIRDRMFGR
jgi:Zn-dependent M28 family amino/carboxypeptidase